MSKLAVILPDGTRVEAEESWLAAVIAITGLFTDQGLIEEMERVETDTKLHEDTRRIVLQVLKAEQHYRREHGA